MRIRSVLTVLALAAVPLSLASPAAAGFSANRLLYCESGGYYHYNCNIQDPGAHTGQRWTYNGSHLAAFDGQDWITGQCAPNLNFTITVTYVKSGVTKNAGMTLACRQYWP